MSFLPTVPGFVPPVPSSDTRTLFGRLVKAYSFQLSTGCGRALCATPNCASNSTFEATFGSTDKFEEAVRLSRQAFLKPRPIFSFCPGLGVCGEALLCDAVQFSGEVTDLSTLVSDTASLSFSFRAPSPAAQVPDPVSSCLSALGGGGFAAVPLIGAHGWMDVPNRSETARFHRNRTALGSGLEAPFGSGDAPVEPAPFVATPRGGAGESLAVSWNEWLTALGDVEESRANDILSAAVTDVHTKMRIGARKGVLHEPQHRRGMSSAPPPPGGGGPPGGLADLLHDLQLLTQEGGRGRGGRGRRSGRGGRGGGRASGSATSPDAGGAGDGAASGDSSGSPPPPGDPAPSADPLAAALMAALGGPPAAPSAPPTAADDDGATPPSSVGTAPARRAASPTSVPAAVPASTPAEIVDTDDGSPAAAPAAAAADAPDAPAADAPPADGGSDDSDDAWEPDSSDDGDGSSSPDTDDSGSADIVLEMGDMGDDPDAGRLIDGDAPGDIASDSDDSASTTASMQVLSSLFGLLRSATEDAAGGGGDGESEGSGSSEEDGGAAPDAASPTATDGDGAPGGMTAPSAPGAAPPPADGDSSGVGAPPPASDGARAAGPTTAPVSEGSPPPGPPSAEDKLRSALSPETSTVGGTLREVWECCTSERAVLAPCDSAEGTPVPKRVKSDHAPARTSDDDGAPAASAPEHVEQCGAAGHVFADGDPVAPVVSGVSLAHWCALMLAALPRWVSSVPTQGLLFEIIALAEPAMDTRTVISSLLATLPAAHFSQVVATIQSYISMTLLSAMRVDQTQVHATIVLSVLWRANYARCPNALADKGVGVIAAPCFNNDVVSNNVQLHRSMLAMVADPPHFSPPHHVHVRSWAVDSDVAPSWETALSGVVSPDSYEREPGFVFCAYPFLLDTGAKGDFLRADAHAEMTAAQSSRGLARLLGGDTTITVYRSHLVQSTLSQLDMAARDGALKRPLKIKFDGEPGIDAGGVQKEFFQLLCAQLFDPAFGMFITKTSGALWFNPAALEHPDEFRLVGMVIGLALYNSVLLEVPFPSCMWRRLLRLPVAFSDLEELDPELAKGLTVIRDWSDESTFADSFSTMTFVGTYMSFDMPVEVPLVPGGETIGVTFYNRHEYVARYAQFVLVDGIARQFEPFERGFREAAGQPVLYRLLRPEDLELLVLGSRTFDIGALRGAARYEGFSPDDEYVGMFWDVLLSLTPDEHRAFLSFCTGTDRVPVRGLGSIQFVVARSGDSQERLPSAHTCFNHLLLPVYDTKELLRSKLLQALANKEGFGLM